MKWDRVDGWIGRCDACIEWFPLAEEFWPRAERRPILYCRACMNLARMVRHREVMTDPAKREALNARRRQYWAEAGSFAAVSRRERHTYRMMTDPVYVERRRRAAREYRRRRRERCGAALALRGTTCTRTAGHKFDHRDSHALDRAADARRQQRAA